MAAWQILIAVGVVLAASEMVIPGFVMLPIGLAFLATSPIAYFFPDWAVILIALSVIEVGVFMLIRKFQSSLQGKPRTYTGAEGMIGQECVVVEPIAHGGTGYVKLYGDLWQAKSFSEIPLEAGRRVVITRIEGNKVYVEPIEL